MSTAAEELGDLLSTPLPPRKPKPEEEFATQIIELVNHNHTPTSAHPNPAGAGIGGSYAKGQASLLDRDAEGKKNPYGPHTMVAPGDAGIAARRAAHPAGGVGAKYLAEQKRRGDALKRPPAGKSLKPTDAVTWESRPPYEGQNQLSPEGGPMSTEEMFGSILKQLDSLNNVAKDSKTLVRWVDGPGPRRGLGGEFDAEGTWTSESGTRGTSGTQWPSPLITVWNSGAEFRGDTGNGYEHINFVHEWGHRVDWTGPGGGFASEAKSKFKPRSENGESLQAAPTRKAMGDFLEAATMSPHFLHARAKFSDPNSNYEEYFTRPTEIWARAYAQWATYKLNDPTLTRSFHAFDNMNNGLLQWPEAEFNANIGPQVEAVLRARGLLK